MNTFENITLFKNLSEDKLESIQNKIKIEKFDNGKKIIVQGEIGDKFYIIKSGRNHHHLQQLTWKTRLQTLTDN